MEAGWEAASICREGLIDVSRYAAVLDRLVRFDTGPTAAGHGDCVTWLEDQLTAAGFEVERRVVGARPPVLVARRAPRGLTGEVVLYNHYDAVAVGDRGRWTHPPDRLTHVEGRLYGRGVADNKGPLAARLVAFSDSAPSPGLTWFIQGEEETGSGAAHAVFPELFSSLCPAVWLEETGYVEGESGCVKLIACTKGGDMSVSMRALLSGLAACARSAGQTSRHEERMLNKHLVPGGCPFQANLPEGANYLAIGVNDTLGAVHGRDESVPERGFSLHTEQLRALFVWVDRQRGTDAAGL